MNTTDPHPSPARPPEHWVLLAFGLLCLGAQSGVTATIALTFMVDSCRELQTEGLIAVIIVRNCLSFAIGACPPPGALPSTVR